MLVNPNLDTLSAECWRFRQAFADARGASDATRRELASQYIQSVYAYQIAKYGKVRQRLSVATLLR